MPQANSSSPDLNSLEGIIKELDRIEGQGRSVMDDDGIQALIALSDWRNEIRALMRSHAILEEAVQKMGREAREQNIVGLDHRAYNLNRLAWELEATALNQGFYGEALLVARDNALSHPAMTFQDGILLAQYAAGMQEPTDHVALQDLANRLRAHAMNDHFDVRIAAIASHALQAITEVTGEPESSTDSQSNAQDSEQDGVVEIKTKDLGGRALNWAIELWLYNQDRDPDAGLVWPDLDDDPRDFSGDWQLAGPLMERERLESSWIPAPTTDRQYAVRKPASDGGQSVCMDGPTTIVAAMRCIVACYLGEKVAVPREFVGEAEPAEEASRPTRERS